MDRAAIRRGFDWEEEFEKMTGLSRTVGSGNKWYHRGDNEGSSLVVSLKYSSGRSYELAVDDWDEIVEIAVEKSKGMPMMGVKIENGKREPRYLAVVDLHSLIALLTGDHDFELIDDSKASRKRKEASVPILFRDDQP